MIWIILLCVTFTIQVAAFTAHKMLNFATIHPIYIFQSSDSQHVICSTLSDYPQLRNQFDIKCIYWFKVIMSLWHCDTAKNVWSTTYVVGKMVLRCNKVGNHCSRVFRFIWCHCILMTPTCSQLVNTVA